MRSVSLVFILTWLVIGAACGFYGKDARFEYSGNEKRYELTGKVVSVEKANQLVNISHEEIKGLMPAMTMPFTLKETWPLEILKPGDIVTATLIIDGPRSWLEDVVIRQESTDSSSSNGPDNTEAKAGGEVPDYGLVNQDGQAISLHDYRGKALLLTFIYTRCPIPDYCTLMSNNFAQVDQELQKRGELYPKTHLLSISIDPEYDTPQVLRSYGAAHTGKYSDERFTHWEFAGGTKDQIKGVAQYFGLRYVEDQDQIIHGLRTVLIAPDGKIYKVYSGNQWKPEEVVKDMTEMLDKPPQSLGG